MNEVRLIGKCLNCYYTENNQAFICKVAVKHDHKVGNMVMRCESVFNVIMTDTSKFEHIDIMQGDKILIEGHLKVDFKQTIGGNEKQFLKVYADNIEVVKPKNSMDLFDTTKVALGIEF